MSGATADASQQRSREARGPLRLAAAAGQRGGVTAAAWGSLCDTITTTLCWCRGSLCLLRIPPELPIPARSGYSRRPRLWLPPSRPRDVTLQPSRRRSRPRQWLQSSCCRCLHLYRVGIFRRRLFAAEQEAEIKLVCWSRAEIGGVVAGPGPGTGGCRRWSCEFAAFP